MDDPICTAQRHPSSKLGMRPHSEGMKSVEGRWSAGSRASKRLAHGYEGYAAAPSRRAAKHAAKRTHCGGPHCGNLLFLLCAACHYGPLT